MKRSIHAVEIEMLRSYNNNVSDVFSSQDIDE